MNLKKSRDVEEEDRGLEVMWKQFLVLDQGTGLLFPVQPVKMMKTQLMI